MPLLERSPDLHRIAICGLYAYGSKSALREPSFDDLEFTSRSEYRVHLIKAYHMCLVKTHLIPPMTQMSLILTAVRPQWKSGTISALESRLLQFRERKGRQVPFVNVCKSQNGLSENLAISHNFGASDTRRI